MSKVALLDVLRPAKKVGNNDQFNLGSHVVTNNVQEAVHIFMAVIVVMIIIFLAAHLFIRYHYKAKTDYALNELREKFEKNAKGPSPYAVSKDSKKQDKTGKPIEIVLEPEQLGPILHHVAMAQNPPPKGEMNKNVYYKANP